MRVELKDGNLVITIPTQRPVPSASGKTMVLASTHGNQATTCTYEGKPLVVGLNVYYKP